jgi:hypothetical protein
VRKPAASRISVISKAQEIKVIRAALLSAHLADSLPLGFARGCGSPGGRLTGSVALRLDGARSTKEGVRQQDQLNTIGQSFELAGNPRTGERRHLMEQRERALDRFHRQRRARAFAQTHGKVKNRPRTHYFEYNRMAALG